MKSRGTEKVNKNGNLNLENDNILFEKLDEPVPVTWRQVFNIFQSNFERLLFDPKPLSDRKNEE